MKDRLLAVATLSWAMPAISSQASAQSISVEELDALPAQLAALEAQVEAVEARVGAANAPVSTAAIPEPVSPPVPVKLASEIGWRSAPERKQKDGWTFKPRGRLLLDAGYVGSPEGAALVGDGFAARARRIRLGFEGTMPSGFGYKVEADFASCKPYFADAFLTYTIGSTTVTIGQQDNFQGLERVSTSNAGSFIERASFNEAFNFERKLGVSLAHERGPWLVQAGIFTDAIADLNTIGNNSIGVDGRLAFAPKLGGAQLHLAASRHWRERPVFQPVTRYRSRPQIRTTDIRFVSTPDMNVDAETDWGLEAAMIGGRFHAAAEAHWLTASVPGLANPTLFGAAVEAGLFLTDDRRGYGKGAFRGMKVKKPVGQGGIGAWQVNARYDHLDLSDRTVVGGEQRGFMASLIWTPIDNVRFLVNYAHLDVEDAAITIGVDRHYRVNTLGMRAQISF
jgi:phosphate-selective porin OprO/OprP